MNSFFKGKKWISISIFILILVFVSHDVVAVGVPEQAQENSPQAALEYIYNERNKAFTSGQFTELKGEYDLSQKFGLWAFEHEVKRVKYLKDWSLKRGMEFVTVHSDIRIKKTTIRGNKASMSVEESYKFDYIYPEDEPSIINSFGVGIRHGVSMIKKDNKWCIYNDWYTDCFEDALAGFTADIPSNTEIKERYQLSNNREDSIKLTNTTAAGKYNREKAVAYADKYCGAAWGSGNNFKYNKKYKDYNGAGGDCTNFASQVLGDKAEGGGLAFGGGWHCAYVKYNGADGSRAWVNADGLKDYLLGSGRGRVLQKGSFEELTKPISEYPQGAVQKLELADLVCYEKKGSADHFGVVTARDSRGYPLVNSHTTDRFHVPWDLGWGDKKIRFFLIHINEW